MNKRREFLKLAGTGVATAALPRMARALPYPVRPVRIVVGFAPGGPQDAFARIVGAALYGRLDQPFVVDNRPGADGRDGAEAAAQAAPDGYTLLLIGPANIVAAIREGQSGFDLLRDVAPVASIGRTASVLETSPSFPAASGPAFIAYVKANPGKVRMASAVAGSIPFVAGELFESATGISPVHVPYSGEAPALNDLIAGRVQALFGSLSSSLPLIRSGKLRALGVTTATRSALLPDVPAIGEYVPGYEASGWYGLGAPKQTPAGIVQKLNREINTALVVPAMRARLANLGATALVLSPGDFGRMLAEEAGKWAELIKAATVKAQ